MFLITESSDIIFIYIVCGALKLSGLAGHCWYRLPRRALSYHGLNSGLIRNTIFIILLIEPSKISTTFLLSMCQASSFQDIDFLVVLRQQIFVVKPTEHIKMKSTIYIYICFKPSKLTTKTIFVNHNLKRKTHILLKCSQLDTYLL